MCVFFGSEALPALSFFQSRQVKMVAWKCPMELAGSMQIPICMYSRVCSSYLRNVCNLFENNLLPLVNCFVASIN